MVLDINISVGEIYFFIFLIAIAPILILMSLHHLLTYFSQNRERSKRILKVVSVLLMFDSGILMVQQYLGNEPRGLLYASVGVFIYSIVVAFVSFRKAGDGL